MSETKDGRCPACGQDGNEGRNACLRCGLIFARYRPREPGGPVPRRPRGDRAGGDGGGAGIDARLAAAWRAFRPLATRVDPKVQRADVVGRALLLLPLAWWTVRFSFTTIRRSPILDSGLHVVNFVFHEAGHPIFGLLGDFLGTLGGSLMQLVVPAVCAAVFLVRTRDPFGGAVGLWWLGQSLADLAPYIDDARTQSLMLHGGVTGKMVPGYHDWSNVLERLGLLSLDHVLGWTAHLVGIALMVTGLAWGGAVVRLQWRHLRASGGAGRGDPPPGVGGVGGGPTGGGERTLPDLDGLRRR